MLGEEKTFLKGLLIFLCFSCFWATAVELHCLFLNFCIIKVKKLIMSGPW